MPRNGFTLIELMVTLTIIAIFAALAFPGFGDLMTKNRLAATSNNFLTDLILARSEAIKRGTPVAVCRSNASGTACDDTGTLTDWKNGWIVFIDPSTSGTVGTIDNASEKLRVAPAIKSGLTLTAPSSTAYFRYFPSGVSSMSAGGTFTLCKTGQTKRLIDITNTGRASVNATTINCP